MKTSSAVLLFVAVALTFSCISRKKPSHANPVPPDQTLTINFYPFWGGSSGTTLERKKGKDNLHSTYYQKVNGVDTVLTTTTSVTSATADSIYALAEKVRWNADANYGTAEARTGLKFYMMLKKGRVERSVSWEKLKNADELPADILSVIKIVNRIAPGDFKIY
jgi:hypothetical protein